MMDCFWPVFSLVCAFFVFIPVMVFVADKWGEASYVKHRYEDAIKYSGNKKRHRRKVLSWLKRKEALWLLLIVLLCIAVAGGLVAGWSGLMH